MGDEQERSPEEIEAMLAKFKGMEIEPSIYRIRGKTMEEYAKAIGDTNPKYYATVGPDGKKDYSKIVAHPNFAAYYTIPGLFKLADLADENGNKLIKNIGKLLHTGQMYDYTDCDELTADVGKVYTTGKIEDLYVKKGMLWITLKLRTTDEEKKRLFCKTTVTAAIRKGGF